MVKARTTNAVERAARWLDERAASAARKFVALARLPAPVYADSTQMGVHAEGTFDPRDWADGAAVGRFLRDDESKCIALREGAVLTAQIKQEFTLGWDLVLVSPPTDAPPPTIVGTSRREAAPFRPSRLVLDEDLVVTYVNKDGAATVAANVRDAGDLVLFSVFSSAGDRFPEPTPKSGVSGAAFGAHSVGNGVSWPPIRSGDVVTVSLAVKRTALYRCAPPDGYTNNDVASVHVVARVNLFGEELRGPGR